MIGQIVNHRYEVLEKIGDGVFFSVYRARDKVLNRLVALKMLSRELASESEFAAAVVEGYQSAAGLTHVNVARVLDADRSTEDCFVACEYVRGINVKERVRRAGPMAVSLVLDVIIPVLEALEYAHANRIVHGDVRPQDVILGPEGEVKLTDFGLAWALDKCPAVADKYPMRSIHYQAPETAEGRAPTAASDIYSVGVMIYEMLTNSLPFDGATAVSIALKKVKEAPAPPRSINAGVPKTLSDITMKAIEADPGDRYSGASQMLGDLRALRDALRLGQTTAAHPTDSPVVASRRTEEEEPPTVGEESLRRKFVLMLALFFLTVLVSLGATMLMIGPRKEIIVPPLLGKTWEEATNIAGEKGLQLVDDGRVHSDRYPADTICSVIPPAGSSVPSRSPQVKVKISDGPSVVTVPDVTGMSEADANETAVREGFTVGEVKERYDDKVPVNSVISQDPPGGVKRPPGIALDLVISLGPKPQPEPPPVSSSARSQRRFNVAVEVPADAEGTQEVVIKVIDDRGETTAYEEVHGPGDKFTATVTTEGSRARIKVYVGGALVSDDTY